MKEAIGILGGTFDPIHYGHLRPALDVAEQLNLSHIRLIPNSTPPHRDQPQATAKQRLLMLNLAVKDNEQFVVDDRELQREGLSYTVDTLLSLRHDFPDTPLYLLVGTDAFLGIKTWHHWQQLLDLCHVVVMQRPDEGLVISSDLELWYQQHLASVADSHLSAGKIWPIVVTQLAISATNIRSYIARNVSVQFLLPDEVIKVINEISLYQADP